MMPGHPDHVIMTGDDPQLILLIPVNRVLFSEVPIIPIGIGITSAVNISSCNAT
jgi:hypothetical protein